MVPERTRNSYDAVGDYSRSQVDRDFYASFKDQDSVPLLGVALGMLRSRGRIDYLDAGCGTGRAAFVMLSQLRLRTTSSEVDYINVACINADDFTDESELADVRVAIRNGNLPYLVADLEDVPLQPNKYDLVTCHEVLIHNDPEKSLNIIAKLYDSLKPGGKLFFTLRGSQRGQTTVSEMIRMVSQTQLVFERRDFSGGYDDSRVITMIEKSNKTKTSPQTAF